MAQAPVNGRAADTRDRQGVLTMYTTPWCGYCRRLKSQLAREGIEITEVDIERDPDAADYVMTVNDGFQTVPTVLFSDGSTLTNPSVQAIKQRMADLARAG